MAEIELSGALGEPAPPGLGERLRQARLGRGLTLADVERVTRINHDYLAAIEREHYDVLPAPVYARGFVRSYARHLGLDPEEAVALLPADMPRPAGLEPLPGLRRTPPPSLPRPSLSMLLFGGAAVALVGAVLAAASLIGGGDDAAAGAVGSNPPPDRAATSAALPGKEGQTVPPFDAGEAPDFTGVARPVAEALLRELDAPFVVIEVAGADAPEGMVFGQSPDPGQPLRAGDTVTLVVSGPPRD